MNAGVSIALGLSLAACYKGIDGADGGADGADAGDGADDGPIDPPENVELVPDSVSRRLSQAELDNTLSDLVGDNSRPALTFLAEGEFTPFDNDYTTQKASKAYVESMEVLAQDVADRLMADTSRRDEAIGCTPSGPDDSACFRTFVENFGRRAFRRPLTADEVDTYMTLQDFGTENISQVENDFYTGAGLVVQALIQDPEFLYRIEIGEETTVDGVFRLDDYEIATRLSYLLWGTMPSDTLLNDAEAGQLTDPLTRAGVIEDMLKGDARPKGQMHRYHAMWLGYRGIPHEQQLVDAFNLETTTLINRVIFEEAGSYLDLFTMEETYVDNFLADHYGLPRPQAAEGWVSYAGTTRAGILSHGSVLAAFSKFDETSPTQRGILIRNRLQCEPIMPPPPDIDTDQPPGDPDDPTACKEARYGAHMNMSGCAGCHSLMDPIGLGLSHYDIGGVYSETEVGKPSCTIVGEGELPGQGTFSGPAELAALLVDSGEIEDCAVRQYLKYTYGRELTTDEQMQVDITLQGFQDGGHNFQQMITDIGVAEEFGFRREPGT